MNTHDFLDQYTINVPVVQRDYVQGADINEGKRNKFVKGLLDAIASGDKKQIHFIYGTIETGNEYTPFDGQQRLTTLNLIGWLLLQHYVSILAHSADVANARAAMLNMTYEVRQSSRQFAHNLVGMRVASWDFTPSTLIKQQIWYAEEWNYDPTIKAMLQLLDYVKTLLDSYTGINLMAHRFFTNSPIEFEETNLPNMSRRQMDDLYIKINARGKFLTEFENWKAIFIDLLHTHHPHMVNEFETKIDGEWCDYFWQYCDKSLDAPRIDEYFMHFYNYVTRILCAAANVTFSERPEDEWQRIEAAHRIYSIRANAETLFKSLDAICHLGNDFFHKYLFATNDPRNPSLKSETRVNIFEVDNIGGINLLGQIISGKALDIRKELLLWGIIHHQISPGNVDTQEFIRQWWTYLMRIRQRQATDYFNVRSNLRYANMAEYLQALNAVPGTMAEASAERYRHDVIPLLNHPWLLCETYNFTDLLSLNALPMGKVYDLFITRFVDVGRAERVRSMLANGFKGLKIPGYDKKRIFGLSGKWQYILTDTDNTIRPVLTNLLRGIDHTPLDRMNWLCQFIYKYAPNLCNWRFCALDVEKKYMVYSIPDNGKLGRNGYRTEPFAYVVMERVFPGKIRGNSLDIEQNGQALHMTCFNVNSTHYGICIRYADETEGVQMECVEQGWQIHPYDQHANPVIPIPSSVLAHYSAGQIIPVAPGQDHVDAGVALLRHLLSLM